MYRPMPRHLHDCLPIADPATSLVFVERHPVTGRLVELVEGTTIGRAGCDVTLVDPEASRLHALLHEPTGEHPIIEDLGSRNGTWVNERRIDRCFGLRPGDRIRLGRTVWDVEARRVNPRARSQTRPDG